VATTRSQTEAAVLAGFSASQGGVFSTEQARSVGFTPAEIRARIRRGDWVRLRRSVYAERHALETWAGPGARQRFQAAAALLAMASDAAAASHWTAAALHDLRILGPVRHGITVSDPTNSSQRTYGDTTVLAVTLPASHVTTVAGVRVTSLERTVLDIARTATFREAVVVADSALRRGAERAVMQEMCHAYSRWRGMPAAARVVGFADPRSDAASESLARVVFAEQNLPRPRTHALISDASGVVAEVDFLFEEHDVIVEIDGKVKYVEEAGGRAKGDRLWREKLRQERLEEMGFQVVRLTWRDLMDQPERVAQRIRAAMARSAARRAG
jgi:predicted transcriptional regulator of viral defense system